MNPNVAVSRRYSARLWRQGALFANARAFKIAIFSLLLLLVKTAPVRAQAPAAPRATPHEAARPEDAYGSCTARRAERGSAELLKDRLAIDRARRRRSGSRGGAKTHERPSVADGGAFYAA